MRCFKQFKDDRTCDLCKISNTNTYEECKKDFENKRDLINKLWKIESKCPHKTEDWIEYDRCEGCNKNGNGYGRSMDYCKPALECEQYCRGEIKND